MDKWLLRILICGSIVVLLLASSLVPGLKAASPQNNDILVQVMGGTTELAAEKAYRNADLYFHAGYECECPDKHGGHEHHAYSPESCTEDLPLIGMVEKLHGESAPKVHKHIQGEEEKELLPWFIAAVRLNPHHIDAWREGAYWFYRTKEYQRAEDFICDAIRHNPKEYRLYLDRGVLYHRLKKWDKSVCDLETAERLWNNNSDDATYDLRAIRIYLEDARENSHQ